MGVCSRQLQTKQIWRGECFLQICFAGQASFKKEGDFVKKSLQVKKEESRWRTPAAKKTIVKATEKVSAKVSGTGVSGLNLTQLKTLKLKLTELKEEFVRSIQAKTQHVLHHAFDLENTLKGDDAEVAEKQRLSNANLQELEFLKTRLQLVDRALLKMNEGCYGLCEETEEPIGYERLSVVPWARFSIKIQEKREIRSRDFGRVLRVE
jgi:DnaK suppressor protein